ncbi:MAG: hypothetical protein O9327_03460 [Polaromonas sp.]|nr:hypothetical protein [Polaromonas sp.]
MVASQSRADPVGTSQAHVSSRPRQRQLGLSTPKHPGLRPLSPQLELLGPVEAFATSTAALTAPQLHPVRGSLLDIEIQQIAEAAITRIVGRMPSPGDEVPSALLDLIRRCDDLLSARLVKITQFDTSKDGFSLLRRGDVEALCLGCFGDPSTSGSQVVLIARAALARTQEVLALKAQW